MFHNLFVNKQPEKIVPDYGSISFEQLASDGSVPITLQQLNSLPNNTKQRLYRSLIPATMLTNLKIDPVTWRNPDGTNCVNLKAESGSSVVKISARLSCEYRGEFYCLEIADNGFNGIDLDMLILNDPFSPRFNTDIDAQGNPTLLGTVRRNLEEEEKAMKAGLAPGQVRKSSGYLGLVLNQLETFLTALGHHAYFLEPLTYASAWVFERKGFTYVRGHKLMDDIQRGMQPDGVLHTLLDGSTPFRREQHWHTVRGRAWAIQDGILEAIDQRWNGLRMVKQIGRHAGVETFPGAIY